MKINHRLFQIKVKDNVVIWLRLRQLHDEGYLDPDASHDSP